MALKRSSSTIVIGARVVETGANTFTQQSVDLQLNPLDNEVFVVQSVNLDAQAPDALAATDTSVSFALTTTSQAAMPTLSSSNTLALASREIRAAGFVDGGVGFQQSSMETPPADIDYIGIISTNDTSSIAPAAKENSCSSFPIILFCCCICVCRGRLACLVFC